MITKRNRSRATALASCGVVSMSKYRKAFLIWLGVMVPLVIGLTMIGTYCESCIIQDASIYRTLP